MTTGTRSELRVPLSPGFASVVVLPPPTPIIAKGRISTLPSLGAYCYITALLHSIRTVNVKNKKTKKRKATRVNVHQKWCLVLLRRRRRPALTDARYLTWLLAA